MFEASFQILNHDGDNDERLKASTNELQKFGEMLGLKIRRVEGRHYKDKFRCRLDETEPMLFCHQVNALMAYCYVHGIAGRFENCDWDEN